MTTDLRKNFSRPVTEEEFHNIRTLIAEGKSNDEIEKLAQRSTATISVMRKHDTFASYKQEIAEKELRKKGILPRATSGVSLTQADWQEVKDILFTGATITEISQKLHRSANTVKLIKESVSLEDYRERARKQVAKYAGKEYIPLVHTVPQSSPVRDRYGDLQAFRDKLDDVLMEFILGEVQRKHQAVLEENKRLRSENEKLQERITELTQPSFTKKLQSELDNRE